jgi:hypothetical protein
LQRITDIVEPDAMGHLRITATDDVTPRIKRASLFIHAGLPRATGQQVVGNIAANLTDHRQFCRGWKLLLFIACRVAGFQEISSHSNH